MLNFNNRQYMLNGQGYQDRQGYQERQGYQDKQVRQNRQVYQDKEHCQTYRTCNFDKNKNKTSDYERKKFPNKTRGPAAPYRLVPVPQKITEIEVSPEKTTITQLSTVPSFSNYRNSYHSSTFANLDEKSPFTQTVKFLNTNGNDFPSKFLDDDPGGILCGAELPISFKMKNYQKAKFSETGGMSNHGIMDGPKSFKPTGKVCAILINKTCCEFGREIEPHYYNSMDSRGVKEFGVRSTKFTEIVVSGGKSFWLIVLHLPVGNTKLDVKHRTSYRILKSIIGQAHHIEKTTKKHVCIVGDFNLTRKEIMIFKKNEEGLMNDYQKTPIPLPSHNSLQNFTKNKNIGTFKTAVDLKDLSSDLSSDSGKDSDDMDLDTDTDTDTDTDADADLDLEYVTSINQEDGKLWDIDYIFISEQSEISFYEIDRSIIGKKGNNGTPFDHAVLSMKFSQ